MSTLIGLLFSIAVTLLFAGVRRIRTPGFGAQLAPFGALSPRGRPRTRYERWVRPLALRLADGFGLLRGLNDPQRVAHQLNHAGDPQGITAHEFYGVQVYALLSGLLIGALWLLIDLPLGPFMLVLLPIAGFYYPRLWLAQRARKRQNAITIALPDLLDMLAVCVSAGMGFDVALRLLAERGEGPLYEELARLLRELRMGEPREQAFRHMAARNASDALRGFIDALLQAEDLGVRVAATLERQAEDMRVSRRYRARAQASKAATKISLVIVLLVVPAVMCMIMGGIVISISDSMRSFLTLQP